MGIGVSVSLHRSRRKQSSNTGDGVASFHTPRALPSPMRSRAPSVGAGLSTRGGPAECEVSSGRSITAPRYPQLMLHLCQGSGVYAHALSHDELTARVHDLFRPPRALRIQRKHRAVATAPQASASRWTACEDSEQWAAFRRAVAPALRPARRSPGGGGRSRPHLWAGALAGSEFKTFPHGCGGLDGPLTCHGGVGAHARPKRARVPCVCRFTILGICALRQVV